MYQQHLEHCKTQQMDEQQVTQKPNDVSSVPIVTRRARTTPIPITDFNPTVLKKLLEIIPADSDGVTEISQSIITEEDDTNATYIDPSGKVVQAGCKKEVKRTYYIRVWDAKKALTRDMLFNTMTTMSKNTALYPVAKEMMWKMIHPERPDLHNMYQSDMTRGTVKVLQRAPESDKCSWAVFPKTTASGVVNAYVRDLFRFLIEEGTNCLVSGIWQKNIVLLLSGEFDKSIVLYEANEGLQVRIVNNSDVKEISEELTIAENLMHLVQSRKEEVVQMMEKLTLEEGDVEEWLQVARDHIVRVRGSLPEV